MAVITFVRSAIARVLVRSWISPGSHVVAGQEVFRVGKFCDCGDVPLVAGSAAVAVPAGFS